MAEMKKTMNPEAGIVFTPEDRQVLREAGYTDEQMDKTEVQSRGVPWNDVTDEAGKPFFEDEIEKQISDRSS